MTTALDTNILIDILAGTSEQVMLASSAVQKLSAQGSVVVPVVCYAELASRFLEKSKLDNFIQLIGATVLPLAEDTAFIAGRFFREYLDRRGPRQRIIADFLIAAQAQSQADQILTKDSRFFKATFPKLRAISLADLATPRPSK